MISQDDIDAMSEASEYRRRAEKGLPEDRWANGASGAKIVARGISVFERLIEAQSQVIVEMDAIIQESIRQGAESMSLGHVPEKYQDEG